MKGIRDMKLEIGKVYENGWGGFFEIIQPPSNEIPYYKAHGIHMYNEPHGYLFFKENGESNQIGAHPFDHLILNHKFDLVGKFIKLIFSPFSLSIEDCFRGVIYSSPYSIANRLFRKFVLKKIKGIPAGKKNALFIGILHLLKSK